MNEIFDNRPIGVFDSGVGGLTVAKAIKKELPGESLIYYGDTKHLPYGDKSKETLVAYSLAIVDFLLQRNVKAIVIACNSASALAFNEVNAYLKDIPVFNVIDPIVDYIEERRDSHKNIGLIATKATVSSNAYLNKINAKIPESQLSSLATPLLVPMIEEGFHDDKISTAIIENYLEDSKLDNIDSLILGCTHYPLIEKDINNFYKSNIDILNSAEIVAHRIRKELSTMNLLSNNDVEVEDHFYISEYTNSFKRTAEIIFGGEIKLEKV